MNGKSLPVGSTPVPDPTILTTQQLTREIAASREIIETRLNAMDTATSLNKEATDKIPLIIDKMIGQLEKVMDEKFESIDKQFKERDVRTEQTQKDSKVAVDAALQAAKEAVGEQNKSNALANAKMETAFTKQIDQIGIQIQSNTKATDDKFEDIKGRLGTLEASINTRQVVTTEGRVQNNAVIYLILIGIATVIGVIVNIASIFIHLPK
jgi:hypothetical protein